MTPTIATRSRAELHERLESRLPEIEQTILTRAHSLSDPTDAGDPVYVEGLREAVSAAIRYGLASLEASDARPPAIPAELFAQARHAARRGVSLDTVLRRYLAGYTLFGDVLMQEARDGDFLGTGEFQRLMKLHAGRFDRLLEAIGAEFESAVGAQDPSPHRRRAECVRQLLAGELTDTTELAYDLDAWHTGAVVSGGEPEGEMRGIARALDCRLLALDRGGGILWVWLGSRRAVDYEDLRRLAAGAQLTIALGEPAHGVGGWRFTHRQAAAALPVALRTPGSLIRYADVALLASMLKDETLALSLRNVYLRPLAAERDGGEALRKTLRAYFAAERNVSSAASALGVSRTTVNTRLRLVEQHLGRSLCDCALEVEAALRLDQLGSPTAESCGGVAGASSG